MSRRIGVARLCTISRRHNRRQRARLPKDGTKQMQTPYGRKTFCVDFATRMLLVKITFVSLVSLHTLLHVVVSISRTSRASG